MTIFRRIIRILLPKKVRALWSELTHWRSPFRVPRWYILRLIHPFAYARRKKLVWKPENAEQERTLRLAAVRQDGSGPAGLDLDPGLLSEVCTELQNRAKNVAIDATADGKGKNFWKHLIDEDELTMDSPFLRLALQPSVLNMVGAYLGEVPYLAYIHSTLSHETDNASWKSSQLWHEDYDDRKMLKLFIYCTDVTSEDDGAFTYIPKHVSETVPNTFFPGRITDETMAKYVQDEDIKRMMGPAGTAFYIDTRNCYHLGSRIAAGHSRIAYMASFVSFASLQSFRNGINVSSRLDDVQKLVLCK